MATTNSSKRRHTQAVKTARSPRRNDLPLFSDDESLLSAIVLAGGGSVRMGRDKAAIEIDGIPLIRRIYDVIAQCEDRVLADRIHVITPWVERYRSILPVNCHFIVEGQPHRGPLMGFIQGLTEVRSTWVLLLACDLPNLSTAIVQTWIDGLGSISPECVAYLPKHLHKGWEPLCGFYRRICLDSLLEYVEMGGRSFQGWLAMNVVRELPIDEPMCLLNCNTPEDLATVAESHSIDLK
jgi:molybdenum cofactor guanylyltransferase